MATIRITDLQTHAIIGIEPEERERRQPVILNVSLDYDARAAAQSDDIADTVNYAALTEKLTVAVEQSQCLLLERLVEELLDLIMENTAVTFALLRVDKPEALSAAKSVSLESSRQR